MILNTDEVRETTFHNCGPLYAARIATMSKTV